MTRLAALFALAFAAGSATAAPINYEFRDNATNALLFTFSLASPPAGTAPGWSTNNPADLLSFVVIDPTLLPAGSPPAPLALPMPANAVNFANNGHPSLLPTTGFVVDVNPFGGAFSQANFVFGGPNPSALAYGWFAVRVAPGGTASMVSRDGVGRIERVPEPGTLAVFGLLAAGGLAIRRRNGK